MPHPRCSRRTPDAPGLRGRAAESGRQARESFAGCFGRLTATEHKQDARSARAGHSRGVAGRCRAFSYRDRFRFAYGRIPNGRVPLRDSVSGACKYSDKTPKRTRNFRFSFASGCLRGISARARPLPRPRRLRTGKSSSASAYLRLAVFSRRCAAVAHRCSSRGNRYVRDNTDRLPDRFGGDGGCSATLRSSLFIYESLNR